MVVIPPTDDDQTDSPRVLTKFLPLPGAFVYFDATYEVLAVNALSSAIKTKTHNMLYLGPGRLPSYFQCTLSPVSRLPNVHMHPPPSCRY
eukprot:3930936-Rhodomonas_salina.3